MLAVVAGFQNGVLFKRAAGFFARRKLLEVRQLENLNGKTLGGKTELKLKEWYHVALVRDGKKVTVYLNGKEEIAGEAESTVPPKCGQIFFGGRNDKFAGLEGRMDEAAIYNRALPAKEIADHFAAAGK